MSYTSDPEAASASGPAACTHGSGPAREPSTCCSSARKVRSGYRREMKRSPSPLKSAGTGQTCDPTEAEASPNARPDPHMLLSSSAK